MHLGLVIHGGLDRLSGGFLYDRMLVQHLQASGWRVDVFALPWGSYLSSLALNLSAQLLSEIESSSIDLLVEDELSHPSLFALNRGVRRHIQIPIVSVVHHLRSDEGRSAWMNPFYRVLERTYLRGVDAAVCNSLATQRSLEALLDRRLPSVVAYPGRDPILPEIDPEQIRTRAIAAGPLKVVLPHSPGDRSRANTDPGHCSGPVEGRVPWECNPTQGPSGVGRGTIVRLGRRLAS